MAFMLLGTREGGSVLKGASDAASDFLGHGHKPFCSPGGQEHREKAGGTINLGKNTLGAD